MRAKSTVFLPYLVVIRPERLGRTLLQQKAELALGEIDESDVINISDIEYETKILDIDDDFATVSVAAKCVVKIWYKYTDEDQSYWDREDQCYLWQMVVELEDTYPISFNMDIKLDISGWLPSVEERQDILFEEYVEMPSTIVLYEDDLLEVEDLTEYPS